MRFMAVNEEMILYIPKFRLLIVLSLPSVCVRVLYYAKAIKI